MRMIPYFLCAMTVMLLMTGCKPSQPNLHIYTWADYLDPEMVERFEKQHDCHIVVDTFDSNEAMYAKLKAGATGYDLIFPSSYFVEIMVKQDMLLPLDYSLIPNIKYLDKHYLSDVHQSIQAYSVPYMITFTGIAYRKDKVEDVKHTWSIFARSDLRGRMTMMNDVREVLGAALRYLGYSVNTLDENQIKEASDLIIKEWKNNLAKFESEQYKNGIASAEYLVAQGYSGDVMQVMQENDNVDFFFPREGYAVSNDYVAIPQHATEVELAHAFINFLQEPEVAAKNISTRFFLSPNTAAYDLLSQEIRDNPLIFPTDENLKNSEVIRNLGPAIRYYNEAWDRIKAAN